MLLVFGGTEHLTHEIGVLDGHIEQAALSGCEIVGYGSLIEVSAVVEFMAVDLLPAMSSPPS